MRTNKFNQMWDHEGRGEFESIRRQRGERGGEDRDNPGHRISK